MRNRDSVHRAIVAVGQTLPAEKARKWETQSGKLFFKHFRAGFHLEAIRACYRAIVIDQEAKFRDIPKQESFYSSYMGPRGEPLFFHLDAFFEAAKTSHDFTLACLGSVGILVSPPNSLHDYNKKPVDDVPSDADRVLRAGWADCGGRTKNYRDCFSHHVALSGHIWQTAINMRWHEGQWRTYLYLPDNPTAQSYDAFTYDSRIDALSLCAELFEQTARFLEAVLSVIVAKQGVDPDGITDVPFTLRNVVIGE